MLLERKMQIIANAAVNPAKSKLELHGFGRLQGKSYLYSGQGTDKANISSVLAKHHYDCRKLT